MLPDGEMTERITAFDDEAMTLSYEVVSGPWPAREYLATVRIAPGVAAGTREVAWSADYEPEGADEAAVTDLVAGTFKMNLKALEKFLAG
jgi:hypothetical protein